MKRTEAYKIASRENIEDLCMRYCTQDFVETAKRYYEGRKAPYHNWNHALDVSKSCIAIMHGCLDQRDETMLRPLLMAAVGHDVYHSNRSPHDERMSGQWVMRYAGDPLIGDDCDLAAAMVEATGYHFQEIPDQEEYRDHPLIVQILMDADLAGLAAVDYSNFLALNNAVTKEVQETRIGDLDVLLQGRRAFVDLAVHAAEKGHLFRTPWAQRNLLAQALQNLDRYRSELAASKSPYL